MLKQLILITQLFFLSPLICMNPLQELESTFPQELEETIVLEALEKFPVQRAEIATVCLTWKKYVTNYMANTVNQAKMAGFKKEVVTFNKELCTRIYNRRITEHEILEKFNNNFFCPNYTYTSSNSERTELTYVDLLLHENLSVALKKIISLGATERTGKNSALFTYGALCIERNDSMLTILKESHFDLTKTPFLEYAAKFFWVDAITYLVNNNADLNKPNKDGMTPLHATIKFHIAFAFYPREELCAVVELLLKLGANQNTQVTLQNGSLSTPRSELEFYKNQETKTSLLQLLDKYRDY
jgi:Ankyrin repeats (many copies)